MVTTVFGERMAAHAVNRTLGPAWIVGNRAVGFDQVAAEVAAFCGWLEADGVDRWSAVGVSITDAHRHAIVTLALLALGIPQVLLPTTDPTPVRESLARRLRVDRVLAESPEAGLPSAPARIVPPHSREARPIVPLHADPDAPAIYITSSGTTGRPKLLAYTQRAIALRSARAARDDGHGPGERVYAPMSAEGILARMTRIYTFLEGATSIMHDGGTTAAEVVGRCLRTRATILQLSAMQAASFATTVVAGGRLADDVKVFSNTARLPAGTKAEFERRAGGRLYDRYGATEVGLVAGTFPRGDEGVPDAVGRILPGAEVEIVGEHGEVLPFGAIGRIRVRTPQMTAGYVDDPELTRFHFHDGWFEPGDAGSLTGSGVLRFLGRHDDMMSLGGFNIFPAEIERVLDAHPAVLVSAAFPLRSPLFGDIPVAAVEFRADAHVAAADLLAYARERLGLRAPRRIEVVGTMPRSPAGKVLKRELVRRCGGGTQD